MPTLDDLPAIAKLSAGIQANDLLPISESSISTSGPSRIKAVPAALAAQGFTHAFVINYDNPLIKATAASGTATIPLFTVPASGRFVIEKVKMVCTRNFSNSVPANLTSATVTVLDTQGSPVTYVTSVDAKTTAAPFARLYNVATTVASATTSTQATLANSVVIRATVALAGTATGATLNGGQIVIALAIHDLADYADLVPALA